MAMPLHCSITTYNERWNMRKFSYTIKGCIKVPRIENKSM